LIPFLCQGKKGIGPDSYPGGATPHETFSIKTTSFRRMQHLCIFDQTDCAVFIAMLIDPPVKTGGYKYYTSLRCLSLIALINKFQIISTK